MGGVVSTRSSNQEPVGMLNFTLLGASNVGKSTIFQQFQHLYTDIFKSDERRKAMRCFLLKNIVDAVLAVDKSCVARSSSGKMEFPQNYLQEMSDVEEMKDDILEQISGIATGILERSTASEQDKKVEVVEDFDSNSGMQVSCQLFDTDTGREQLRKLVAHINHDFFKSELSSMRESGCNDQLNVNQIYLLEIANEIIKPNFIPSQEYLLRIRRRTEEAAHLEFNMPVQIGGASKVHVKLTDMGGFADVQERWRDIIIKYKDPSCVELTAFVINLSSFTEIDVQGRSVALAQLSLCDKIVQSDLLGNTQIVVLINKMDMLEEKLKDQRIADYVPVMRGYDNTVTGCTAAVEDLLVKLMKKYNRNSKPIVLHTCALDTSLMHRILQRIVVQVFEGALSDTGMM